MKFEIKTNLIMYFHEIHLYKKQKKPTLSRGTYGGVSKHVLKQKLLK